MNKFILSGRLTADFELKYTQTGNAIVRFNFAVNRRFKKEGEPEADFFQCVAFGKTAELFTKCNIGKGTKLLLDCEVRNNNYEKDGVKHYSIQLVVNSVEFMESKAASVPYSAPATEATEAPDGFTPIDIDDSDLPF